MTSALIFTACSPPPANQPEGPPPGTPPLTTPGVKTEKPAEAAAPAAKPETKAAQKLEIPKSIDQSLIGVPTDVPWPDQHNFDVFGWQEFIALNWPADTATCTANSKETPISNQTSPRVWQTYLQDSAVFPASGSPPAWCSNKDDALYAHLRRFKAADVKAAVDLAKKKKNNKITLVLDRISKAGDEHVNNKVDSVNQAVGGVLTDQNGRFVRYQVMVSEDAYKFIVQPLASDPSINLWTAAGQAQYFTKTKTQSLDLPPNATHPGTFLEVKASWKVLSDAEQKGGRFFMSDAVVNTAAGDAPAQWQAVTVGLVGMHIAHKTKSAPQWAWSTFEHVDNTTVSFNNKNCPQAPTYTAGTAGNPAMCTPDKNGCCLPNTQTIDPSKPAPAELKNGKPYLTPVQVVRAQSVSDSDVDGINASYQKLLAGSVWANYKLISTMWPTQPQQANAQPAPGYLANTTMETFNQGPTQPVDANPPYPYASGDYDVFSSAVSSSCLKCHSTAQVNGPQRSDFSFLFGNARSN